MRVDNGRYRHFQSETNPRLPKPLILIRLKQTHDNPAVPRRPVTDQRRQLEIGSIMTMTLDEARRIAIDYLKQLERGTDCELVMLDGSTLEREFGWVFFYKVSGPA